MTFYVSDVEISDLEFLYVCQYYVVAVGHTKVNFFVLNMKRETCLNWYSSELFPCEYCQNNED